MPSASTAAPGIGCYVLIPLLEVLLEMLLCAGTNKGRAIPIEATSIKCKVLRGNSTWTGHSLPCDRIIVT